MYRVFAGCQASEAGVARTVSHRRVAYTFSIGDDPHSRSALDASKARGDADLTNGGSVSHGMEILNVFGRFCEKPGSCATAGLEPSFSVLVRIDNIVHANFEWIPAVPATHAGCNFNLVLP